MSDALSNTQILGTLDRLSKLYPGGIPRSAITRRSPSLKTTTENKLALIVQTEKNLDESERTLVEAICGKGLKLSPDRYEVSCVDSAMLSGDLIRDISASSRFTAVLILGTNRQPGTFESFNQTAVIWSYSLSEIASDPFKKRNFWEHLKRLMPVLG